MPMVQMTLLKGRDEEKVQQLMKNVARVISETIGAPLETIRIMVNEIPPTRFAVGDKLKSETLPNGKP